jgi:hypothetical protein
VLFTGFERFLWPVRLCSCNELGHNIVNFVSLNTKNELSVNLMLYKLVTHTMGRPWEVSSEEKKKQPRSFCETP